MSVGASSWLEVGVGVCCSGLNASRCDAHPDRVVGRAAAFLYCLLDVSEVYSKVMSRPAAQVLVQHGITVHADTFVDGIINRQGTGPCPFEAAVMDATNPRDALSIIRKKLVALQAGGSK